MSADTIAGDARSTDQQTERRPSPDVGSGLAGRPKAVAILQEIEHA